MNSPGLHLLLADDDDDDCQFFREALEELSVNAQLVTVANGVDLMKYLSSADPMPDALFLDLNMPRKNGFECLAEIKNQPALKSLPVIIYSTSYNPQTVQELLDNGAHQYLRKPAEFSRLKQVIADALDSLGKQTSGSTSNLPFTNKAAISAP